jgi:Domain of unknown function (DUF1929)/Concanavalin A-like lectin/glucanases superfamily/Galactose oxidase, central domain
MAGAADSADVRSGAGTAAPAAQGPADVGAWQVLPFHSEVLAVHAALLPSGDVLFAAGSGNSLTRFQSPDFGDVAKKIWVSVVWDPTISPPPGNDTNFFHPATPHDGGGKVLDFFCGGETFLPDGRLLSAGGTLVFAHPGAGFTGRADTVVFDPATEQWAGRHLMQHGRWYPSLINLGDGRVLVTAGLSETGRRNTSIETFFPGSNSWQVSRTPQQFGGLPLYAHLYLLADGSVCYAGGHMDDGPADALRLDLSRDPVVVTPLPGLSQVSARDQCASVLLPPAQAQRVMIMGGAPGGGDAIKDVDVVDFSDPHPVYRPAAALAKGRKHLNATLLPDRTVLVTGGSGRNEAAPLATNEAEVYDPGTDTWQTLAAASVTRMYHSVALLLPDGRVVTAGGNPKQGTHVEWDNDPNEEMRLEIYSPPYLFRGARPVIDAVSAEWRYGQTVNIASPDAEHLRWASLIRPGSTTHSFNTSQRLVDLPITAQAAGSVQVTVPAEPNLAPPGWYMLFLTDNNRVPSAARWIHLGGAPDTALPGSPYNHAILGTPALAGYWPLAEAGGTVAFDVFGANHGSYIGHPELGAPGAGPAATAVALNGRDQYVLLPRLITDDFSLELWFSSRGGHGTNVTQWWQAAGLLDGEVPGTVDDFGTSLDASGQVWAGTGKPDTSIHSRKGLADGKWHHVVLTRKESTGALTLFVDGVQASAGRGGSQRLTSAPGLRAGVLQSGRNFLAGSLADIGVYSSALPPATVTAHFHARQ